MCALPPSRRVSLILVKLGPAHRGGVESGRWRSEHLAYKQGHCVIYKYIQYAYKEARAGSGGVEGHMPLIYNVRPALVRGEARIYYTRRGILSIYIYSMHTRKRGRVVGARGGKYATCLSFTAYAQPLPAAKRAPFRKQHTFAQHL